MEGRRERPATHTMKPSEQSYEQPEKEQTRQSETVSHCPVKLLGGDDGAGVALFGKTFDRVRNDAFPSERRP